MSAQMLSSFLGVGMSNLSVVKDLYAAFRGRDRERILELLHPQVEWVQAEGFPGGARRVGPDEVLSGVFDGFRDNWDDWKAGVDEYLDGGDAVIALGAYSGTFKRTGRSMHAPFAHVYRVRDGRIVHFQQYTDTRLVADAMSE